MVIIIRSNRLIYFLNKKVFRIYKIISKSNFLIYKKIQIKKGNFKKIMKQVRVMMQQMRTMIRKTMFKSKMKKKYKMKEEIQNPKRTSREETKSKKKMKNQKTIMIKMDMTHIKIKKGII